MGNVKVGGRIFRRCLLEFGPPAIIGIAWAAWNYNGTAASAITNFSAAFVSLGIFWANFLRIQYQQTTRAQQDASAAQLETVKTDLSRVEGAIQKLTGMVAANISSFTPERARELTSAVNEANNAVTTANNAVRELSGSASIGSFIVRGALGGLLKRDIKSGPPAP